MLGFGCYDYDYECGDEEFWSVHIAAPREMRKTYSAARDFD
jgi:hypothetical protein